MRIAATVQNTVNGHRVTVSTAGMAQELPVGARANARGSGVNGGEFLMLALATCYCNDIFREADRLGIPVDSVEVEAQGDFDAIGVAGRDITYRARIDSKASAEEVEELLRQTDAVAEVQKTVRVGAEVSRVPWDRART